MANAVGCREFQADFVFFYYFFLFLLMVISQIIPELIYSIGPAQNTESVGELLTLNFMLFWEMSTRLPMYKTFLGLCRRIGNHLFGEHSFVTDSWYYTSAFKPYCTKILGLSKVAFLVKSFGRFSISERILRGCG